MLLRGRCVRSGGRRRGPARARGKVERTAPAELGPCRCAPGPAPCARVACVGRYGMRYFYVAPGIRPFNDPTRPAPHRSPLRSRRRSRRRKREQPIRGAVLATTTYDYERRVMGDAVCRLRKRARRRAQVGARRPARSARTYIRIGRSRTEKLVRNRSAVRRPLRQSRPEASPAPRASPPSAAQWPGRRRAPRANAICATMPSCA